MMKKMQMMVLFLILSCGNDQRKNMQTAAADSKQTLKSAQKDHDVCDLLNKKLIQELYPSATNFNHKFTEVTYPTCTYKFEANGKSKQAKITAAFGFGSLKNFDKAMTYLSDKEAVNNLGQKAYYIPKIHQLSAWDGKNIIHVNINNNKEKTITATKAIFKKLK